MNEPFRKRFGPEIFCFVLAFRRFLLLSFARIREWAVAMGSGAYILGYATVPCRGRGRLAVLGTAQMRDIIPSFAKLASPEKCVRKPAQFGGFW